MAATATFIETINSDRWNGDAKLYRLSEPLNGYDLIVACVAPWTPNHCWVSGCDVLPTAETAEPDNTTWLRSASADHNGALMEAGYVVA